MSALPSILVIGTHNFDPEQIIKLISRNENVNKTEPTNGLPAYNWKINNKYYTTDVNLYAVNISSPLGKDFKESIEAVVIYFDIHKENSIVELNECINYTKDCDISEKILVCKSTSGLNEIEKDSVANWCIKNEYELVELEQKLGDKNIEDGFLECVGIDRIIEILHAHEWSNLVMKGKPSSEYSTNVANDLKDWNLPFSALNEFSPEQHDSAKNMNNENAGMDEKEHENMEQLNFLFKNLQSMKNEISSLTAEQKLEQAEKVVKAFWNAIGGDADEFSDSDEGTCT